MEIKKVAVIGAGVMGSGIAAHMANAGVEVLLLDIVPKDAEDRSVIAKSAVQKMLKTEPAPFMHKRCAKLVTPGNIEDDLGKIADCDWVVEAVLEDLDIKRDLYEKLEQHRRDDTVVSSNTSTIPLDLLTEGRSNAFKKHFMITHFFNPPRYMRLLEVVEGANTDKAAAQAIREFCDVKLGKGLVDCKDTPGFIANRIGVFWLTAGINEAIDLGVTVEEADAVMSRPVGIPKTGVFGLLDLVGIDLIPHLAKSLKSTLPGGDGYVKIYKDQPLIDKMIADGYTGRKGKGGFYRLNREGGKKVKESINLETGDYAKSEKIVPDAAAAVKDGGLKALVSHDSPAGKYAWRVLGQTLHYAASLVPEICDDVQGVDDAMKLGYNWKQGPFELIDALGVDWFAEKLAADGMDIPPLLETAKGKSFYRVEGGKLEFLGVDGNYRPVRRLEGALLLSDIKLAFDPVAQNGSAALWDVGDGVLCLEFTGKMNALDHDVMAMIGEAVKTIGDGAGEYKALVVHNEGTHFSAGANLGMALQAVQEKMWDEVEKLVTAGQQAYVSLKYAPFPVIGAPSGMALGGGCEILLHCDAIQAHAELYVGLVEVGVGIVPAWGGCKEMILRQREYGRFGGPVPPVTGAFQTIGLAKVSKSALEAKDLLYLRPDDGVTMNRDRLLADAKAKALQLAKDYTAPEPEEEIRLPGPSGKLALMMAVKGYEMAGQATPHDVVVSEGLATVLSGGAQADIAAPVNENDMLDLEREVFMELVRTTGTHDRIQHMLETGRPLRN